MGAPDIKVSTKEERENFIRTTYRCIADCDSCGICQIFRGTEPLIVFKPYIEGQEGYREICEKYR